MSAPVTPPAAPTDPAILAYRAEKERRAQRDAPALAEARALFDAALEARRDGQAHVAIGTPPKRPRGRGISIRTRRGRPRQGDA